MEVLTVSFAPLGRTGEYALRGDRGGAAAAPPAPGSLVVVEGFKGVTMGRVIGDPHPPTGGNQGGRLRRVVRPATREDIDVQIRAEADEPLLFRKTLAWIRDRRLDWKLVRVVADGLARKVTVVFAAAERADVREAGRALGRVLRLHVMLRQVGRRDLAKTLGGVGRCGRELCCSTFLRRPPKTSIRQAKDQNLALSEEKTHGVCGGTLCCLAYEHDVYLQHRKYLPRLGRRARTADGREGKVVALDVLKHAWVLRDETGARHPLTAQDWDGNEGRDVPPPPVEPPEVVPMPGRRNRSS